MLEAIRSALDTGVPLFNAGRAADCARVYASALRKLAAGNESTWIERELLTADGIVDDRARAWHLRHVLDHLASASGSMSGKSCDTGAGAGAGAGAGTACVFDFSAGPVARAAGAFRALNDGVMGGRSSSSFRMSTSGKYGVFEGCINTNGGGFAGQHAPVVGGMPGAAGVDIFARGDGQLYKLALVQDGTRSGVSYQCDFQAGPEWQTHRLPFARFQASWRGRPVPGAAPLLPPAISRLGLRLSLLTDDGRPNTTLREGAFRLDVKDMRPFYS